MYLSDKVFHFHIHLEFVHHSLDLDLIQAFGIHPAYGTGTHQILETISAQAHVCNGMHYTSWWSKF